MRVNLVHIYLYVLVEACIVPCYVDCKAYPFLQKDLREDNTELCSPNLQISI